MEMQTKYHISLNFFPLNNQDFSFLVYRKPYQNSTEEQSGLADCRKRDLPGYALDSDFSAESHTSYWVTFKQKESFEEYLCHSRTNSYLTIDFLFYLLRQQCKNNVDASLFIVEEQIRRRIDFVLSRYPQGVQTVSLSPYLLKSTNDYGFLADFKFIKALEAPFDRTVQQLSLSLDKNFRENRDFYVNRFEKLQNFLDRFRPQLFPLIHGPLRIDIVPSLVPLGGERLKNKQYVFSGDQRSHSQFVGIKSFGPLKSLESDVGVCFVYRPQDKPFSLDLYRALLGKTYATFSGMQDMFGYELNQTNILGVPIQSFDKTGVDNSIGMIRENSRGKRFVPLVIVPWHRIEDEELVGSQYYTLKHGFLRERFATQFVSLVTLQDRNKLKWSISNIGLALFAKMGGMPWKVKPENEKCLIVGIGQAHKIVDGRVQKYFAYSILTDSSGLYEDLRVLSRSEVETDYLEQLKTNLISVFELYADRFQKFAIHTPFSLRRKELAAICDSLKRYSQTDRPLKEFVVLKFNEKNKFFGYYGQSNSLVPYESSCVKLSQNEYLIWFEGLQYHNPNISKRIQRPIHIQFYYPRGDLSEERKRAYLQDALNLSGANWRGFNAKSLPISVYYAQLVARYFQKFYELGLEEIDLENLPPWFL